MGDFFLFIFAVWFIIVTMPWWLLFGFLYGVFIAIFSFFGYASKSFKYISYEGFEGLILLIFVSPFMAIWDGLKATIKPVSYFWDFARYDHPIWAFVISIILLMFYTRNINEY